MRNFADDMEAGLNIGSAHDIARHYECPVIYFARGHEHAYAATDYRAIVFRYDPDTGKRQRKTFPVDGVKGGVPQIRKACVAAAQEWAAKFFDITDWKPTGFYDSWMPQDIHNRMRRELKEWRKKQEADVPGA